MISAVELLNGRMVDFDLQDKSKTGITTVLENEAFSKL
jgi:hypothetical protein